MIIRKESSRQTSRALVKNAFYPLLKNMLFLIVQMPFKMIILKESFRQTSRPLVKKWHLSIVEKYAFLDCTNAV